MIIYIDLFFVLNFIGDYIILSIACPYRGYKKIRKIIISVFASLYSCLFIQFPQSIFFSSLFKTVFFILMITAVLIPCNVKAFFAGLFKGIFSLTFICGTIYSLSFLLGYGNNAIFFKLPTLLLLTGLAVGYCLYRIFLVTSKNKLSYEGYTLEITYNKKKAVISCEADTGNSLSDPVFGYPVIVADQKILERLFTKAVKPINLCEFVRPEDFKTIPYKTISDSGILYGFIPDKLYLNSKRIDKAILAFAPNKLSADALINPLLIQKG